MLTYTTYYRHATSKPNNLKLPLIKISLTKNISVIMFISKTPFIGPIKPITLDEKPINCVSSSSCLGVTLDNKLSWSPHIKLTVSDFNAKITKLKQLKSFERSTLESVYFKAIIPSATYCISLWGSSSLFSELEDSHVHAVRLIHNLSHLSLTMKFFARPNGTLYYIFIRKDSLALLIDL